MVNVNVKLKPPTILILEQHGLLHALTNYYFSFKKCSLILKQGT